MKTKTLEVRDTATFIPVLAIRAVGEPEPVRYLLGRAGYGTTAPRQREYVLLIHLVGPRVEYNPVAWGNRTMETAHAYIQEHFDILEDGDVIDVQYIRGETRTPKLSERLAGGEST
jgi:hypothetical protein